MLLLFKMFCSNSINNKLLIIIAIFLIIIILILNFILNYAIYYLMYLGLMALIIKAKKSELNLAEVEIKDRKRMAAIFVMKKIILLRIVHRIEIRVVA